MINSQVIDGIDAHNCELKPHEEWLEDHEDHCEIMEECVREAYYENMPDQQIIERLADWMYENSPKDRHWFIDNKDFNPLEDWNHWRQVEEKVMEDDELFKKYLESLSAYGEDGLMTVRDTVKADLPTRCRALLFVLNLLKKND